MAMHVNYIQLQFVWIKDFYRWEVSIACWSVILIFLLISQWKTYKDLLFVADLEDALHVAIECP